MRSWSANAPAPATASESPCPATDLFRDGKFHDVGPRSDAEALVDPLRAATFRRFFWMLGTPDPRNLREDPRPFRDHAGSRGPSSIPDARPSQRRPDRSIHARRKPRKPVDRGIRAGPRDWRSEEPSGRATSGSRRTTAATASGRRISCWIRSARISGGWSRSQTSASTTPGPTQTARSGESGWTSTSSSGES